MVAEDDNYPYQWTQVEERVLFRNDYIGLRNDRARRPDGVIIDYIVLENKNYSAALCLDQDNRLVMIRQYRYPWGLASWEIPSGIIDQGETPEECAIREVKEETGYEVIAIETLLRFHPTGLGSGECHLFLARVRTSGEQTLDPSEFIQVGVFEQAQVDIMIGKGEIVHTASLMGWMIARSPPEIGELLKKAFF